MTRKKKADDGVHLPPPVPEADYPTGDGPAWISAALGVPGCLIGVSRSLSDDGEETSLVLYFGNGREQTFRPARLVTTRRLADTLGSLGFPVPYYQPPQLALIGQAIGRVADRAQADNDQRSYEEMISVIAGWLSDCRQSTTGYVLRGRDGKDVRAAIEHVRRGYTHGCWSAPLIVEPSRGVLLAWTVPVTAAIRDRLGTKSDGDIGMELQRAELTRERLAARPGPGDRKTHELPVWVVSNGWQGFEVEMPSKDGESDSLHLDLVVDRSDPSSRARPGGRARTLDIERSTTPNGERPSEGGARA